MYAKQKTKFYRYTSFILAVIITVLSIADTYFYRVGAEDETAGIASFSFALESGAEYTDGRYIWTPSDSVTGHQFIYRLSYAFAGEGFIEPGEVEISVPKHILEARNGFYADLCELPMTEISESTGGNEFAYYYSGDNIIITNVVRLSFTGEGIIDIAYATTRTTFYYSDGVNSDAPSATMTLSSGGTVVDTATAAAPAISIDTSAELVSATKKAPSKRVDPASEAWDSTWGTKPDDADDYYYTVWTFISEISATQTYMFEIQEDFNEPDSEIVGYKLAGRSTFTNHPGSNSASYNITFEKGHMDYVLTRHKKESYPDEHYVQRNAAVVTVTPVDEPEKATSLAATAIFNYDRPEFLHPDKNYQARKYGNTSWKELFGYDWDIADYELTEFVAGERETISGDVKYCISVISSPYPYTLREEADPDDFEQYGKNPVDYILIDDRVYFNDEITTEMEEINIPDGTEPLTWEDYEIDYIYYYVKAKDARFNSEEMKFEETDPTYTDDDILYFDARFGASDEWIEIGDYHLKTAALHYDEAYVRSMTNRKMEFRENCTAYRIRTSNAHYVTTMEVYPYYKVKRSERILQKIGSSMFGDEMAWLTNMGSFEIKTSNGESVWEKEFLGRDYFIGYRVTSSLNKKITSFENDNADKYATLSWKIDMEESYISNDGKHYIKQNTGTFYDLLPQGGEVNLSTVAVQTEGGYLDPSGYDVSAIVNYRDTGRTMLVVKMKDQFEYATLTFDLIYSWESVVDYGRMVLNSVAYETGNETITDGFPDNGGTISEGSLMADIDTESDGEKFLYAEAGHPVDILISAVSGLTKTVKSPSDYLYSNAALVHQNGSYTYKLRYSSTGGIVTDDLVLFDSLENFSNDDVSSDWHGILQGIDTTQPASLGAAPVVYYSSLADLDINLHHDLDEEIGGMRVWKTEEEFGSIENAKAVAVDLRKDTQGNDFAFSDTDSIVVLLYMKAPPGDNSGVEDPTAYNGVYASYRMTDDIHYTQESFNDFGYTEVTLRIMADINIRKVSTKDNTTPIKGISFRLSGTSDYGTSVDKLLMTDVDGKLSFKDIEKGTYILTEIEGNEEYLPLEAPIVVVIDNNGSVSYDGAAIMEGTYYTIGDVPRLHSDVTFYKRDMVYTSLFVEGARFELTGTSEYGNEITLYAQSDAGGAVIFPNIELGTYTMRETNTDGRYIMDGNVYIVKVTDNDVYSIRVSTADGQGDSALLGTGLNGVYSIYNEPYHEFTIQKEAYADGMPVAGAVFNLKGETASGNYVDISQTTRANGRITFNGLESGVYTLQETSAPYGFGLDPTVRTVIIDKYDHITVSDADTDASGFFVIVNKENGAVTITKKWLDGLTNDEREQNETDAVIHLTTEKKEQSAATFKNSSVGNENYLKSSGVVSNLNNVRAFRPFTGDDAEVQVLIDSGTAKRMDTEATAYSIYAWFISDTAAPDYGTVYWWSDAQNVYLQTNTWLLRGLPACVTIDVTGLNTSKIASFSYMFNGDSSVTYLNLRSFDTSNATNMEGMFYGCSKLVSADLRRFNTSKVTNMSLMFLSCTVLNNLDLSSFDTSSVTTMARMFEGCRALPSLDLSSFDTSRVTSMATMFRYCNALADLDISSFDTSCVKNMSYMFGECKALTDIDVSRFDTSVVENFDGMFSTCSALTEIDLSSFDTSNGIYLSAMFNGCTNLLSLDVRHFDTSSATTFQAMFASCQNLTSLDLSSFTKNSVTTMREMFRYCYKLTDLNLTGFDTSSCNDMYYMFAQCSVLPSLDLSSFDTSSVTDMTAMFYACYHLSDIDLRSFDTSSVKNMSYMFNGCFHSADQAGLRTLDLSSFDMSSCVDMTSMFNGCQLLETITFSPNFVTDKVKSMSGLFQTCRKLTTLDLSHEPAEGESNKVKLNTQSVIKMESMFNTCNGLTFLDVSGFNTAHVTTMANMFNNCNNLAALDVSGFDTSRVTTMVSMFGSCYNSTTKTGITYLDVSGFDTSRVTSMASMFSGCGALATLDVSGFNTTRVTSMAGMFNNCYSLTALDVSGFDTSRVTTMASMFSGCYNSTTETGLTTLDVAGFHTGCVMDMSNMFNGCKALTSIDVSGFDTVCVTNMTSMFSNCNQLTDLDVSHFDTSAVKSMNSMFNGCTRLTAIDVSHFDTTHVTIMGSMFSGCSSLAVLDVSGFDTALVTTMASMFNGCSSLAVLDVSGFDTHLVTSMSSMFTGCGALTVLDVSGFRTPLVTTMSNMFYQCRLVEVLDVSRFETGSVTSMASMFRECNALTALDLSSFSTLSLTSTANMFQNCTSLSKVSVSRLWDMTSVTSHSNMFSECSNLSGQIGTPYNNSMTNKTYARIDTEDNNGYFWEATLGISAEDAAYFRGCPGGVSSLSKITAITNIKAFARYTGTAAQAQAMIDGGSAVRMDNHATDKVIYAWNTNGTIYWWSDAAVVYLTGESSCLFSGLTNCTSINLTGINTSKMTAMSRMFENCQKLTALNLGSSFDTSGVRTMYNMFYRCYAITSLNLSGWDVSNVVDMSYMFCECAKVTTITPGTLHAEKVRTMQGMFQTCSVLATLDMSEVYTRDIGNMESTFRGCVALKKINLDHFSAENLFTMSGTFYSCNAAAEITFGSDFTAKRLTTMESAFYECRALKALDLSSIYASNIINMTLAIYRCDALTDLTFGSHFVTSKVTTFNQTFRTCTKLTALDISMFDTSNCVDMYWMFRDCSALKTLTLSTGFDTANVVDMQCTFYNCAALTSLDASGFNTANVVNMNSLFYNCKALTSLDVSSFSTANVVDMSYIFQNCSQAVSIDVSSFDMSHVVDMPYMFSGCSKLTSLDLSRFSTESAVDMMYLFNGCSQLTGIDLSAFLTENVVDMKYMFNGCSNAALTTLDVSGFDTSSVTDMRYMFYNCANVTALDLASFDTAEVVSMEGMFQSCKKLTGLDLRSFDTKEVNSMKNMFKDCLLLESILFGDSFDTAEVSTMEGMFYNCQVLTSLDLSGFDTASVTSMANMFYNCKALARLDVSSFDTSQVVSMASMFQNCAALTDLALGSFHTGKVSTMASMFAGCSALTELDLSSFVTPKVTDMSSMFSGCTVLSELDVSHFDTQRVTTMASMFLNCKALTTLDLSNFVTPKVTTMASMFQNCENLAELDVSHFDTRKVTNMASMFSNCKALTELDLSSFVTPKVTAMSDMFNGCLLLESIDVSGFNTENVTTMSKMFYNCNVLRELDLSHFDTPKLTSMYQMFYNCYALERLDISHMNTSGITDMSSLFYNCKSLTQLDLSSFNTYYVTSMASMFSGCKLLESVDLTNFNTSHVNNMNSMFYGCTALETLDLSSFDISSVTNMRTMLQDCAALQTVYVSNYWDISNQTDYSTYRMFWGDNQLIGGNGTAYIRSADIYTNWRYAVIDTEETPGYLTYKAASVNNATDLVSTEADCVIVKVTDSVWTYTFTGLNPNVQYYAWEEEIEDYISSHLIDSPLAVENLKGTITNRHQDYPDEDRTYGSLSIKKVLRAENGAVLTEADYDRAFVFTVTLTDENGDALSGTALYGAIPFVDGTAAVRVPSDTTAVLDYIPSGYHYVVTEEETMLFAQDFRHSAGTIEADETAGVVCTNTKSAVEEKFNSFRLKKIVTGNYEMDAAYLFTIVFDGLHPHETYTLSDDSTFETNNRGTATIDLTLRNGQEIAVLDLPVGSSYKITEAAGDYISSYFITETDEEGYIVQPAGANTTVNQSLSTTTEYVEQDEDITVTFTNAKDARQNVRLMKVMENASASNYDTFTFTAEISGLQPNETIRTGLGVRIADETGKLRFSFEMSANDELLFYDLPVGCTYQFTEAESEWVSSYRLTNDGSAGTIVSESAANDVNHKALHTAVETVNEKEEVTVTFTNTKVQRDLTITKLVDMPQGGLPYAEYSTQRFKFLVKLTGLEGGQTYEMAYTRQNISGIADTGTFTAAADGSAEVTIFLTHGLSVRIKNLPEGAGYVVTEYPAINYISSYEMSGNEGAVIVKASDRNRKTCRMLSTAAETVEDTELDVRVVFTNRYYDDPTARICMVQIEKAVDTKIAAFGTPTFLFRLHNTDTGDDFTCSITLDGDSLSGWETVQVTKGHYTVEEVAVSRYAADSAAYLSGTTASDLMIDNETTGIGEVKSGGRRFSFLLDMTDGEPDSAYLKFTNKLTNYSGVSHNSFVLNHVA